MVVVGLWAGHCGRDTVGGCVLVGGNHRTKPHHKIFCGFFEEVVVADIRVGRFEHLQV